MPAPISLTTNWTDERIDEIIDVRSPAEFAEDHIPGAINLPVFSNEERAEIGTIYKQQSPFLARRKGAALVSKNIASHIHEHLLDRPENWRPLIHCWRGGQRSRAFAHICAEIGWACFLLDGGYKAYRGQVLDGLRARPSDLSIIIISGKTGAGKTHLLQAIATKGGQIIDLEGLACHKGSLLGADPEHHQPSQRFFESQLFDIMRCFDRSKPVFIEAESSRVGDIAIPKELWHMMSDASVIELESPFSYRLELLKTDYPHLLHKEAADLHNLIEGMTKRYGKETTTKWREDLLKGDFDSFITQILSDHYDPSYERTAKRHERDIIDTLHLQKDNGADFDKLAEKCLSLGSEYLTKQLDKK